MSVWPVTINHDKDCCFASKDDTWNSSVIAMSCHEVHTHSHKSEDQPNMCINCYLWELLLEFPGIFCIHANVASSLAAPWEMTAECGGGGGQCLHRQYLPTTAAAAAAAMCICMHACMHA